MSNGKSEQENIQFIENLFETTETGNMFFEIKDGLIFPRLGTDSLFGKKGFLPIKDVQFIKQNPIRKYNYDVTRTIFGDGLIETKFCDHAETKCIIDIYFANCINFSQRCVITGNRFIPNGRIPGTPILSFDHFDDECIDLGQILVGRTNDCKIEEVCSKVHSETEINTFKQKVTNYYLQKYKTHVK